MDIIKKYFPELSEKQFQLFQKLNDLYVHWNVQINVISRKDIDNLYERHILHSLSIAKIVNFRPGSRVLDAGTGGGLPGIPLAIVFPDTYFHLVDSIGKKIKVVHAISNELGLKNILAEQKRVEQINNKYDFIVSRAVTKLDLFESWVNSKIKKNSFNTILNGILYLKGGDFELELKKIKKYKIYNINDFFSEEFFQTKKLIHIY